MKKGKMSKEYNYKHPGIQCENCKTNIYVVQDQHKAETYCMKCGTVLIDTTLPSITCEISKTEYQVKFIRNLWKKK